MRQAEHHAFHIFDGSDRLSMAAVNENTEMMDSLLKDAEDGILLRGRIQTGSYEGRKACQAIQSYSGYAGSGPFKTSFGRPNDSGDDVVITVDFEPKILMVSAYRAAPVSWSGTLHQSVLGSDGNYYPSTYYASLSGLERQSYRQVILHGLEVCQADLHIKEPGVLTTPYPASRQHMGWITSRESGGTYDMQETGVTNAVRIDTLVKFGVTEDGKHTVTIKGANSNYGTHNYADIAGMTYHWTAIG